MTTDGITDPNAKSGKFDKNRIFDLPKNQTIIRFVPELANEIGLYPAILLLQIEFWTAIGNHLKDGVLWTYQTTSDIKKKVFPFLSERTVRTIVKKLEDQNLILTANHNSSKFDKTKWYAINVEEAAKLRSLRVIPYILGKHPKLEKSDDALDDGYLSFEDDIPDSDEDSFYEIDHGIPALEDNGLYEESDYF